MKRSLGVLSRAVLIGVSAAVLVAPAALAATPATGAPAVEQPDKQTPQERLAAFIKRAEKIEKDVAGAAGAVAKAKTYGEAKKAKAAAVEAEAAGTKLWDDLQAFLSEPLQMPTDDRVKTVQTLSRSDVAVENAKKAIAAADKKIKELRPAPEISVEPGTAGRGDRINIVVFCTDAKVSGFASDAIAIVPSSRVDEGALSRIGGSVKADAAPGTHQATAQCGTDKLTATFTVTAAAPVEAKPPTADDVRRMTVVKPKGKIETGGGATAQSSI